MLRIGLVGIGFMGRVHMLSFTDKPMIPNAYVKNGKLVAVCDIDSKKLEQAKKEIPSLEIFSDYKEMLASGKVDAVIIATPHYLHPLMGIEALKNKIPVLIEKPVGVFTKNVFELNEVASQNPDVVFGLLFNQRTNPFFVKAKEIIDNDGIGKLKRMNWMITNWYRPQKYYDNGSWRGTWAGEGGGVLMNQAPHQIDLWQWLCGMPTKVRAYCKFGKNRNVEVETDVTAYVEYPDGGSGVFVTSTHDAPGTNRLELIGNNGKIVIENEILSYKKLLVPENKLNETATANLMDPKNAPQFEEVIYTKKELGDIPWGVEHAITIENWINTIEGKEELIAPGIEGVKALELINSMLLSTFLDKEIELPIDSNKYYEELMKKCEKSEFKDTWRV
ncbi:Gfo/Idh/MocA family protein [Cetobacterium sp.]|uniref:Gfo/Idh/MocA family protein n=1 Tax=Cetobacterium sp. TaxID=2071632 RepID=UPI003F2B50F6